MSCDACKDSPYPWNCSQCHPEPWRGGAKHDARCTRRRQENPYLCTCGMDDGDVAAVMTAQERP